MNFEKFNTPAIVKFNASNCIKTCLKQNAEKSEGKSHKKLTFKENDPFSDDSDNNENAEIEP